MDTTPKAATAQHRAKTELATAILEVLTREWFPALFSAEANRLMPALLLAIYVSDKKGRPLNKSQLCELLRIDPARTGGKYVKLADEAGLVSVVRRADEDKRKDFLVSTPLLDELMDLHLASIGAELCFAVGSVDAHEEDKDSNPPSYVGIFRSGKYGAPEAARSEGKDEFESRIAALRNFVREPRVISIDPQNKMSVGSYTWLHYGTLRSLLWGYGARPADKDRSTKAGAKTKAKQEPK